MLGEAERVGSLEFALDPIHFDGVVDEGVFAADVIAVSRLQPVDDIPKRKRFGFSADVRRRRQSGSDRIMKETGFRCVRASL